ncbi:MAG: DUF896 domain-containing protein [Oscillospiraceae bacterium]|nr:DUF896 domain-containing protein [Oscillospiraceae bacterium]
MNQEKKDRISELTAISRTRELTDTEAAEREALRREYLAEWRQGAKQTLDRTVILYPDGTKKKFDEQRDKK